MEGRDRVNNTGIWGGMKRRVWRRQNGTGTGTRIEKETTRYFVGAPEEFWIGRGLGEDWSQIGAILEHILGPPGSHGPATGPNGWRVENKQVWDRIKI